VFYCTEDVEKHVVDDEYGPWTDGKEPKEDLVDLVRRISSKGSPSRTKSRIIQVSRPAKLCGRMENQDMARVVQRSCEGPFLEIEGQR